MQWLTTAIIAAALTVTAMTTADARPRKHYSKTTIITCNERGCSDWVRTASADEPRKAKRQQRRYARASAMRVDEVQQYVKPDLPSSKLVTREAYERNNGIVRSYKTGATARVSPKYAPRFQSYINDVEVQGAKIYYMGGWRPGRGSLASQHPWGAALDICQDARGRVSGAKDCNLPRPTELAAIAKRNGLYEGSAWCNSDYGHAQALPSARDCPYKGPTGKWGNGRGRYLASMTGSVVQVTR